MDVELVTWMLMAWASAVTMLTNALSWPQWMPSRCVSYGGLGLSKKNYAMFLFRWLGFSSTAFSLCDWCLIYVNLRLSCVWNVIDFRKKVSKNELHFRQRSGKCHITLKSVWTSSWNCVIAVRCIIAVIENANKKGFISLNTSSMPRVKHLNAIW